MAATAPSRSRKRGSLFGGRDIAVDLGTANTIVFVRGQGIVLNEPSVVAFDSVTGNSLAFGHEAKRMLGRTPGNISAVSPLRDGVIADFDICEKMLRHFINKATQTRWPKPRMVICVPSGITGVEKRAVQEAAEFAGARSAFIIEEPMAAAIGSGLPVQSAQGSMIVDIGGGTTEVAVISLGGIVTARSARVGGNMIDGAISTHIKKEHGLIVGDRTAEEIKLALGSAWPLQQEIRAEVRGRDMVSGLPESVSVDSIEIREAISVPVAAVVDSVKATLDDTAPELAADVMDYGITLAGGGAMLRGLTDRMNSETGVAVRIAEDPLLAVVRGSGQTLEEFDVLHGVLYSSVEGR